MDVSFFTHAVALSAAAVVVIQQILKWKVIPISIANRYPVPTNIVLSILASAFAVWQGNAPHPVVWTDWLLLAGTVSVTAALTYNQLLKNWTELRATEGTSGNLVGAKNVDTAHDHQGGI